jgi:hypothetical protein
MRGQQLALSFALASVYFPSTNTPVADQSFYLLCRSSSPELAPACLLQLRVRAYS